MTTKCQVSSMAGDYAGAAPSRGRMVASSLLLVGLLLASCSGCDSYVDYTVPPVDEVFARADALVRARVVDFPNVDDYVFEAELEVSAVLADNGRLTAESFGDARLTVGAYDDPCGRRSGMRIAKDEALLVILEWVGPDNGTWTSPWHAFPVLREERSGTVTFLDTNQGLNERIDRILPEPTVSGLIATVLEAG